MNLRGIALRIGLIVGGGLVGLALLTLLLMALPGVVFGPTTYDERASAGQTVEVAFKPADGDLFVALPGSIRPPADNPVLEQFSLSWDAQGFRIPARQADTYPVAVFGDSFTEGFNVPVPYPDALATLLDQPVRNYGYRAYGPAEVAQAAREVLPGSNHDWIIYGYFSGNDLGDAVRPPKLDTRSPVAVWGALVDRLNPPVTDPYQLPPADHYDFPMPVIIGGNYYELAFLWYYWWWQLVSPDDAYLDSRNFQALRATLTTISDTAPDACKVVAFIPTKEALYYRYIYETERRWIRENAQKLVLADDESIRIVPAPLTDADEPAFITALDGQRDMVQKLVEAQPGWHFIDLTPAFAMRIAEGALLYYPYDSHWNQAGHEVAAAALAAGLPGLPCQPQR